jgi:hypothetical protein
MTPGTPTAARTLATETETTETTTPARTLLTPAVAATPLTTALPVTAEALEKNTSNSRTASNERKVSNEKPGFQPIFEKIHEKIVLKKEMPTSDITESQTHNSFLYSSARSANSYIQIYLGTG